MVLGRRAAAAFGAVLAGVGLLVPFASAADNGTGLGIKLVDAPANRQNDPRAQVYIVDHVRPGASFTRRFEVRNDTPNPHHILLYADAATVSGGGFNVAPGQTANELTTWMSVTPASLDLPARGSAIARVSITVPRDAAGGERYGVVLAEFPAAPDQQGVLIASRVGIRVYLDVGAGGEPPSDFAIEELTASRAKDGTPYAQATVRNTGGRALDMSGTLKLSDGPGGLSAGPFPARLGTTLAPGQSEPVTVALDKQIPAGPWRARMDLRSGLIKRAAEATITFPTAPGTSATPVKAQNIPLAKNRHVLVPVAVLLLVALAIALFLLLWRRRRRDEDDDEHRKRPAAAATR